jgi:hypothetical protein
VTEERPFVDPGGQIGFWRREYLEDFLRAGGAAVKWLTGRAGAGKTQCLCRVREEARTLGYLTAEVSARRVAIGRIDELYRALMAQLPLREVGRDLALAAARRAGAEGFAADGGQDLEDALVASGRPREAAVQEVRTACDFLFAEPNIAPPMAVALRLLALGCLRPAEAAEGAASAERFLRGERIMAAERHAVGITMRLDRYSAREMLRSFLYALRLSGIPGLVVTLDDLEQLLEKERREDAVHYTKMRRDDTYEAIRELIDEGGTLPGLFLVIAGRPEALRDERFGVESYAALAMRVAREVRSTRINPYDDLIDLDEIWQSDWPTHRAALARAYGAEEPREREREFLLAASPLSPLRLFLRAIGCEGGEALGA